MSEITAAARDKRREIVRAAAVLFDTQGYVRTSMTEIAHACGMQKPTLYHYFARKDAILFEIHEQLMDHLQERLTARRTPPTRRAVDIIEDTIHDVLAAFTSHPGYARVFMESHRELPSELRAVVAAKRDRYADEFEELLARAQEEGDLRQLDPKLTRLSVLGMVSWAYNWLDTAGPLDSDAIAAFMWDLLLRGVHGCA